MGNALCGGAAAAAAAAQEGPCSFAPPPSKQRGAAAILACSVPLPPPPGDEIEAALRAARAEVDRGWQRSFGADYDAAKVIGHGAFCRVLSCSHRATGQAYAVKVVDKAHDDPKQREGIIKEVAIMRMLAGHPNVVQLQSVYEDEASFHLVMELCSGGELFDQIVTRRHFREQDARAIMRPLLDFVAFAHSKHIVHRDLKPENILLSSKDASSAVLKVIDFGTSDFCKPGQRLAQKFGTPYYVAPEVMARSYGPPVDTWSAGVILFILLSGYPPFSGSSDARILQRVRAGAFSFAAREWGAVTDAAKDMVRQMLVLDEEQRSSAAALLQHPWFALDLSPQAAGPNAASAAALGAHIVRRLRGFAKMSHLKRLALKVMARTLTDKDVSRLRALFMSMDKDDDGTISPEDLQQALQKVGAVIGEHEVAELFVVSDLAGPAARGKIEYEEFIAAMLDSQRVAARSDAVRSSFETLDRDGDGFISVEDLAQVLQEEQPAAMKGPAGRRRSLQLALQLVREVDTDNDGSLSYEDFRQMWLAPEPVAA